MHDFPASIGIDFQMAEMKRQQQQQHNNNTSDINNNNFTHSIKIQETEREREGGRKKGADRARDDEVTEAITHLGRPPHSQTLSPRK